MDFHFIERTRSALILAFMQRGWKAGDGFPPDYLGFIIISMVFSLPTLATSWLVYWQIKGNTLKPVLRKLIMIGLGTTMYVTTMLLLQLIPPHNESMLYMHISYTACFLLYSFICKTTKKPMPVTPGTPAL